MLQYISFPLSEHWFLQTPFKIAQRQKLGLRANKKHFLYREDKNFSFRTEYERSP